MKWKSIKQKNERRTATPTKQQRVNKTNLCLDRNPSRLVFCNSLYCTTLHFTGRTLVSSCHSRGGKTVEKVRSVLRGGAESTALAECRVETGALWPLLPPPPPATIKAMQNRLLPFPRGKCLHPPAVPLSVRCGRKHPKNWPFWLIRRLRPVTYRLYLIRSPHARRYGKWENRFLNCATLGGVWKIIKSKTVLWLCMEIWHRFRDCSVVNVCLYVHKTLWPRSPVQVLL